LGEGFGLTPELRRARIDEELGIAIQRERPGGRVISFGHSGSEAGYSANVQHYPCTGAVWASWSTVTLAPVKPSSQCSRRSSR